MSQFHYSRKERLAHRHRRPPQPRRAQTAIFIITFDCLLIALIVILRSCSAG